MVLTHSMAFPLLHEFQKHAMSTVMMKTAFS